MDNSCFYLFLTVRMQFLTLCELLHQCTHLYLSLLYLENKQTNKKGWWKDVGQYNNTIKILNCKTQMLCLMIFATMHVKDHISLCH